MKLLPPLGNKIRLMIILSSVFLINLTATTTIIASVLELLPTIMYVTIDIGITAAILC